MLAAALFGLSTPIARRKHGSLDRNRDPDLYGRRDRLDERGGFAIASSFLCRYTVGLFHSVCEGPMKPDGSSPRKKAGKGRNPLGKPNPIDIHVGTRIRQRRTLLGLSQSKLAEAIGLTFQQVQKYERGTNRVGSSRMFEIARVLGVPVAYFFEDMGRDVAARGRQHALGHVGAEPAAEGPDPLMKRETLELVRAYYKITDRRVRRRLFEMTKALAG